MIIFGILGDIGSGKSYVAEQFGLPVFNADNEVTTIYRNSKVCFTRLSFLGTVKLMDFNFVLAVAT